MDQKPYRILREKQLPEVTGLKRTAIGQLVKSGEFPQPILLTDGGRAKGWLETEILAWQAKRISRRGSTQ